MGTRRLKWTHKVPGRVQTGVYCLGVRVPLNGLSLRASTGTTPKHQKHENTQTKIGKSRNLYLFV